MAFFLKPPPHTSLLGRGSILEKWSCVCCLIMPWYFQREEGDWGSGGPLLLNIVKSVEGEPPNFPLLKEGGEVLYNLAILESGPFLERWVTIDSSPYFQREVREE